MSRDDDSYTSIHRGHKKGRVKVTGIRQVVHQYNFFRLGVGFELKISILSPRRSLPPC